MEALYAILADIYASQGGLKGSNDKMSEGRRYNDHARGVYFHLQSEPLKVLSSARYSPVFWDGSYLQAYLKVREGRSWRVVYQHKDHKVQTPNGDFSGLEGYEANDARMPGGPRFYYESLFIQHVGYQQLQKGDEFAYLWQPSLEARPAFMKSLPHDHTVSMVAIPLDLEAVDRDTGGLLEGAARAQIQLPEWRGGLDVESEKIEALGLNQMQMPAAPISTTERNANDAWALMFIDYLERFHPGEHDM